MKIEILKFTVTLLVIKIDSNMSFGEDKEDVILETYRYPIKCQCCPHIETSHLICTAI